VVIDEPEAVRYARLAAENGDALGHAVLARALRRGTGTAKDAVRASEHAKESADAGNLFGLAEWGICLVRGVGAAADEPRGAQLCRRSAEGGRGKVAASGASSPGADAWKVARERRRTNLRLCDLVTGSAPTKVTLMRSSTSDAVFTSAAV
jgi:TPR repeat protein